MSTHTCPWWLAYTFDNRLRRWLLNPERLFAGLVGPGDTALDIGCGMGVNTLGLARLVGPGGRVTGIDIQERMLGITARRAAAAGLGDVVVTRKAKGGAFGLEEPVDLAVCFWMAHEVGDQAAFFAHVRAALKTGGRLFLAEPKAHVGRAAFTRTMDLVLAASFTRIERPAVFFSRAVVFEASP